MTFAQLVKRISRKEKYTDFFFEDNFHLCAPRGITKETARRRYRATTGRKAPMIEEYFWFVAE